MRLPTEPWHVLVPLCLLAGVALTLADRAAAHNDSTTIVQGCSDTETHRMLLQIIRKLDNLTEHGR